MNIHILPNTLNNAIRTPEKISKGIEIMNIPAFWEKSNKGKGNIIAVIDSGCETTHPELKNNIIGGYNFTQDDDGNPNIYTDYIGHGTHVVGTIAAQNNSKIIGIAPESKLLILKVIDSSDNGEYKNLIKAIQYASAWRGINGEKVSVINLSIGGSIDDPDLSQAVEAAIQAGIILIAASGNYGDDLAETDEILYPAYYNKVIEIGSINQNYKISSFSNSNNRVDFVAPGEKILSTYLGGTYAELTGTSMAAPHVTGLISLLINHLDLNNSPYRYEKIYAYLLKNCKSLSVSEKLQGNGLIQIK
ncbi:S8 family peptidase [Bacillus sp. MMSF_3353]|uniref:S8 family peptidase n=1 Tax=Bacillus sp. MMSF_3353 TaxID=3047081 RepID=UPI00273ED0A5|nr:S8 family peptidase [Bacillus sp. MMSF_3353]